MSPVRQFFLGACLLSLHSGAGCGVTCSTAAVPAMRITVVDAQSGDTLCTDPDGVSLTIEGEQLIGDCVFGLGYSPGEFDVEVVAPGYESASVHISVHADQCGQSITEEVTVPLLAL